MSLIAFLLLGLIAGSIAHSVLPEDQGGGRVATFLLGSSGAILGGWLGTLLFGADIAEFWSLGSWLCAIGGSIIALLSFALIERRRKHHAKPAGTPNGSGAGAPDNAWHSEGRGNPAERMMADEALQIW